MHNAARRRGPLRDIERSEDRRARPKWGIASFGEGFGVPRAMRGRFQRWVDELQCEWKRPLIQMTARGEPNSIATGINLVILAAAATPISPRHGTVAPGCTACGDTLPIQPGGAMVAGWLRYFPKDRVPMKLRSLDLAAVVCPSCQQRIEEEHAREFLLYAIAST